MEWFVLIQHIQLDANHDFSNMEQLRSVRMVRSLRNMVKIHGVPWILKDRSDVQPATAGATSVLWSPEETMKFSSHSHQDTFCDWTTLFKRCTVWFEWILSGFCVDSEWILVGYNLQILQDIRNKHDECIGVGRPSAIWSICTHRAKPELKSKLNGELHWIQSVALVAIICNDNNCNNQNHNKSIIITYNSI